MGNVFDKNAAHIAYFEELARSYKGSKDKMSWIVLETHKLFHTYVDDGEVFSASMIKQGKTVIGYIYAFKPLERELIRLIRASASRNSYEAALVDLVIAVNKMANKVYYIID